MCGTWRVWDSFSGIWSKRRGDQLDWYYSEDRSKVLTAIDLCPTEVVRAETGLLTACYSGEYPIWFIEPFTRPDFGTQLHEISHDFVFSTYWGAADFPWFIEGTGMYYEGGVFQADGSTGISSTAATIRPRITRSPDCYGTSSRRTTRPWWTSSLVSSIARIPGYGTTGGCSTLSSRPQVYPSRNSTRAT
jgi:hypothetical protein